MKIQIPPKKSPVQAEAEAAEAEAKRIAEGAAEEGDKDLSGDAYTPLKADEEGNVLPPVPPTPIPGDQIVEEKEESTEESPSSESESEESSESLEDPAIDMDEEWPLEDYRHGNTYNLYLEIGRYENGGIALQSFTEESHEPFATYTVNVGAGLPRNTICVKNWSEGEGAEEVLLRSGIIEGTPISYVPSGYVKIPVYKLSSKFLKWLKG